MSTAKYKILLLGDGNVGKTSLIMRFTTGRFKETYKATIGTDIFQKIIDNKDLQIWDLSGQSHFKNIRMKFYKRANGSLIVFDLTNPNSFESLENWVEEAQEVTGDIPSVLVGNKKDLDHLIQPETLEKAKKFAESKGIEFVFTSAKNGDNVEEAFKKLAEVL